MTPERWQKVEEVLQGALDRPAAERAVFLHEACAGDDQLAREAISLIDAHEESEQFFSEPAFARDALVIIDDDRTGNLREIGPYRIIERIGGGGMGEVHLAHDPRLDRPVALKVIRSFFVSDQSVGHRFQSEARLASALNHANILTVYDVGQFEDTFFIATEYVDGPTIRERIRAQDLTLDDVLQITEQLLTGLEAAHNAGIIHRDIKPENIIQRRDGVLKILDFGIAKLLEQPPGEPGSQSLTYTETGVGVTLGTIGYMSPEQVRALPVDQRTDIWSCGVVLYEMLNGRRPFDGQTNADSMVAILERQPAPIFTFNIRKQRLLRRLADVAARALNKNPDARYQTAAEMRAEVQEIHETLKNRPRDGISEQTRVSELDRLAANSAMRREVLVAAIAALVVIALLATFVYRRWNLPSRQAPVAVVQTPYLQLSEAEKLAFVEAQEQRISAMMGERPVKLNDEALHTIKTYVDRYAQRTGSTPKPGADPLNAVYARAPQYIPVIARAFSERKIPLIVGIYIPMIESEYKPCYENEFGAKGLFQFLPATAGHYGVSRDQMCDVNRMAPAAAHFIADRMAELGDDAQSMTLVLLSYNRGEDAVREALRQLRETDANYERNFWTLFANRKKLDKSFQRESAWYVPSFFAAAIVGENPQAFEMSSPPLSSFATRQ